MYKTADVEHYTCLKTTPLSLPLVAKISNGTWQYIIATDHFYLLEDWLQALTYPGYKRAKACSMGYVLKCIWLSEFVLAYLMDTYNFKKKHI